MCQAGFKYARCHRLWMVPPEVIVIVALRHADLARLHTMLVVYESPFTLPGEECVRCEDEWVNRELRERIGRLLAEGGRL